MRYTNPQFTLLYLCVIGILSSILSTKSSKLGCLRKPPECADTMCATDSATNGYRQATFVADGQHAIRCIAVERASSDQATLLMRAKR